MDDISLSKFILETDYLRLVYSIFLLIAAIVIIMVSIRTIYQDKAAAAGNNCEVKCEIQKLEKQLQKLKDTL
ncbi:MAG: hypothetical protein Q8920_11755 [Bacillota bacterium]|nr:hypothetical protein [Bacillota bacterium]